MTLSPDRIQYLKLRATTDCLLAFQVGEAVEFYDHHAEAVARVCGLPLEWRPGGSNGKPVAVCGFPIMVFTDQPEETLVRFSGASADRYHALMEAGYPLAVACRGEDPDGAPFWKIMFEARPQIGRPPLRVV